ncbi:pirin family protein [Psychrobium sp. 1_MG-2023]|uniref:pirin family protein n=1 Tax=Psychrobium sp. 1_MG-2023 TaxID=3062624 RepID=UPI000C32A65E|nr:pirin family protein [Psychrobium sp. 1_MG-2023]MDP2562843.1 pirin family protein [Psychrobium sp. 1_MG-2023]PKF54282.1 quercetin 2,3-dioxygenase [Alteromonadales bacterium alter-6D02]
MSNRSLIHTYSGINTADGDGVKLTRIIGSPDLNMLDPFLLLDCFESDQAQDYIGGFPEHPHRGFETVTYLLNGKMRHKDNAGHEGVIEPGGVQWMTAGRGILHSEMPEQENGLLQGFQLWVNLPKCNKMTAPDYQEYSPQSITTERLKSGGSVKVIAGKTDQGTIGPVRNNYVYPTYMDIELSAQSEFKQSLALGHNAFIYVLEGLVQIIGNNEPKTLKAKGLGILSDGDAVHLAAKEQSTRLLLIAGQPLNEPVARGGPFVMNTQAEVRQAFLDYQRGLF